MTVDIVFTKDLNICNSKIIRKILDTLKELIHSPGKPSNSKNE